MPGSQPRNALPQQLVVLLSNQPEDGGTVAAGKVQHLSHAWHAAYGRKLGDVQTTSITLKDGLSSAKYTS